MTTSSPNNSAQDEQRSAHNSRRATSAALVGTIIEYYEFGIYGYLSAVFGPLFFPGEDPIISLLATLAVFGVSFVIRPLGGILLGSWGDRFGRRKILILTILGMGLGTAATGALPTYAAVGVAAPILLVAARLAQGFFAGGEIVGAAAFVGETVPPHKRAFYTGFVPMGAALGGALAAGTSALVTAIVGQEGMAEWGWRIPFLLAIPLIIITLIIRARLEESPEFRAVETTEHVEKAPIITVLKEQTGAVLKVIGVSFGQNTGYWVGIVFMNIHLTQNLGYDTQMVFWFIAAVSTIVGVLTPYGGALSDIIGRKKTLYIGYIGYMVLVFPMMLLMNLHNPVVAFIALLVLALPYPLVQSTGYTIYAEAFPTRVRYTGMAISFNIGTILGGGLMPFVATGLIALTNSQISPAFLMLGAGLVAVIAIVTLRETSKTELQR